MPDIPGIEHVIDSDVALNLPSKPEKIAIVGGGYIALEFASIFNGLKSEVHVFIWQHKVLRGFNEDEHIFRRAKIALVTDKNVLLLCLFFVLLFLDAHVRDFVAEQMS
jgi:glutathione reductase (NADPH)